jgi:hypothetical protein
MVFKTGAPHRVLIAIALLALVQAIFAISLSADGVAVEPALAAAAPNTPYALEAQALIGHGRTDLYLTPASETLPRPNVLDKVQVKTFATDGAHITTQNFFDVAVHDGVAAIPLDGLARQ